MGESLVGSEDGNAKLRGAKLWDPEDMALRPDVFLSHIDPEQDRFGLKAALQLWLELEQQGFMATGLPMYSSEAIRSAFNRKLAEISPVCG